MISVHKLHSHIHYEEAYLCKKSKKFSIKTLTTIACPNFRNKQKGGPGNLGVNVCLILLLKKIKKTSGTLLPLHEKRTMFMFMSVFLYFSGKMIDPFQKKEKEEAKSSPSSDLGGRVQNNF